MHLNKMAYTDSMNWGSVSLKSEYVEIHKLTQHQNEKQKKCDAMTSCRWIVAYVCFWGTAAIFTLRQAMSMALVCMFPEKGGSSSRHDNSSIPANQTQEFDWSDKVQGLVLSAHFYGYLLTPMFGGYLAARYGGKEVLAACMAVTVLCSLLTPAAASFSPVMIFVLRFIIGLSTGPTAPAMQEVLNRWAPAPDKSKLLAFSYAGSNVGNVIAFGFSGFLCTAHVLGGWPLIFYVFGGVTVLWIIWLLVFIHNSPESHPRISSCEKQYIRKNIPTTHNQKNTRPPWRQVLTSLPLIACLFCQFVNATAQTVLSTTLPLYMRDVLEYQVEQNGVFSALPPVGRLCGMLITGYLSDYIINKEIISLTAVRKIFLAVGYLIPAASLLGLSYLDSSQKTLAVLVLIIQSTSSAAAMITLRVNVTEIAPRYASVLVGAYITVNGVPGIIVPIGVTVLTADGTREQWQIVFLILVALYVTAVVIFTCFGKASEQSWAKYESLEYEEIEDSSTGR